MVRSLAIKKQMIIEFGESFSVHDTDTVSSHKNEDLSTHHRETNTVSSQVSNNETKKKHSKVYRDLPSINDVSYSEITPVKYSSAGDTIESQKTIKITVCDKCRDHIDQDTVNYISTFCENKHHCLYHPQCWNDLNVSKSILCPVDIFTSPHYMLSYQVKDDILSRKHLIIPQKCEYLPYSPDNATADRDTVDTTTESIVGTIENKHWEPSHRQLHVDIPLKQKFDHKVNTYAMRKREKRKEKQQKFLEINLHCSRSKDSRKSYKDILLTNTTANTNTSGRTSLLPDDYQPLPYHENVKEDHDALEQIQIEALQQEMEEQVYPRGNQNSSHHYIQEKTDHVSMLMENDRLQKEVNELTRKLNHQTVEENRINSSGYAVPQYPIINHYLCKNCNIYPISIINYPCGHATKCLSCEDCVMCHQCFGTIMYNQYM